MPPGERPAGLLRVDLGLGATVVIWGVNYSAIKAALSEVQPNAFNALRFVLATFMLAFLARGRGTMRRIPRRDLAALAALGLLGNAVYQILFIQGIAHTTAANASLIMSSCPMLVALLGAALGRESLPTRAWGGVLLAVAGLVLLLSSRAGLETGHLLGDLLVLAAAATWAAYSVLAAGVMARTPPVPATLVTLLSGTPALVVIAMPSMARQNWGAIGTRGWFGVAFSGILAIGTAYMLWNTALAAIGSARTAVYQNFTPVVAAGFAWLTLGERWTGGQLLGAAAVLAGIALTRRAPSSRRGGGGTVTDSNRVSAAAP